MDFKARFNVSDYLQIIKRRKLFFIVPFVLVFVVFFVAGYILPKTYEAKAVILVEEKKVVNPLLKNLAVSTTVAERLNTLREEILAWPRLYQLVQRLGLNKNVNGQLELERLISAIRRNIYLTMRSGEVVMVAYRGEDPRQTQKLVNTLTDILIERNISLQSEDTDSAIDFINKQLAIYEGKLRVSEGALRQFKEIYGTDVLPQLKIGSSSEGPETTKIAFDESSGYTAPLVKIGAELSKLEADLVMASIDCTDEHPRIKDLKSRISSLKEKRDEYIQQAATRSGVESDKYVDIAGSLPRQQEELSHLTRDRAINERIHSMLLERLESAKITERLDSSESKTKFRIIEPARLPLIPVKPNKIKLNLLGLLLGAMLGAGLVYLVEYIDSSFKNADDLKNSFEEPVLGTISRIVTKDDLTKQKRKNRRLVTVGVILVACAAVVTILVVKYGYKFGISM